MEKEEIHLYEKIFGERGSGKEDKDSFLNKNPIKRVDKKVILYILGAIILILLFYFMFFNEKHCKDNECFNLYLKDCKKTDFTAETKDSFWYYQIEGKNGDGCKVYIKLLQLKEGFTDMNSLENLDMYCYPKLGNINAPQKNLDLCEGQLKEAMQKIVIDRLHNYIVSNLGEIKEGIESF